MTLSVPRKFVTVRDLSGGSVGILGESLETTARVGSVGWICLGRVDLSGAGGSVGILIILNRDFG